jgi:hypothetical protein
MNMTHHKLPEQSPNEINVTWEDDPAISPEEAGRLLQRALESDQNLRTFRLPDGSYQQVFEAPETGEFPDEIDT